jgi:hypothetical protein
MTLTGLILMYWVQDLRTQQLDYMMDKNRLDILKKGDLKFITDRTLDYTHFHFNFQLFGFSLYYIFFKLLGLSP